MKMILGKMIIINILVLISSAGGQTKENEADSVFGIFFSDIDSLEKIPLSIPRLLAPAVDRLGFMKLGRHVSNLNQLVGSPDTTIALGISVKAKLLFWADTIAAKTIDDTVRAIVISSKCCPAMDGYVLVGDKKERIITIFGEQAVVRLYKANTERIILRHCGAWFLLNPERKIIQIGIFNYGTGTPTVKKD
ncbi:MAG: hypothetical protein DKINENOH_05386 [bacterium]|nr:hypothetical protein [bacterium]